MTTADLNLCAPSKSICRQRGDTFPWTFTILDSEGSPLDVTGFTFLLTVDPAENPTTSANNLFQLTGSIVAPPTNGVVQFSMTALQADHVGSFFYDLQMTDGSGNIRTVIKGPFTFEQDVTK